jgi:hypothetical protein
MSWKLRGYTAAQPDVPIGCKSNVMEMAARISTRLLPRRNLAQVFVSDPAAKRVEGVAYLHECVGIVAAVINALAIRR